ncbi:MAG: hypothetical protein V3S69_06630 [Dehalococcoidales bacterium]
MSFDAQKVLDIDYSDLENEFREQAIKFQQVYSAYVEASRTYDLKSEQINVTEAQHALAYRAEQTACGKKVTEKMVDQYLLLNEELQSLRQGKIAARAEREMIGGLVKSLEHRRDALKAASYTARSEVLPDTF